MRAFEESEMLIEIEENKQIVVDPAISEKLYERYIEKQKS